MRSKSRSTNKYLAGILALFAICLLSICGVGVLSSGRLLSAPTPPAAIPIETIVEGTANAARLQTLSVSTSVPTSASPVPPTFTPSPGNGALADIPSASCVPNKPPQTGVVVEVVDGDTIKVKLDQDGRTYSVRYIGMDAPESTIQHEPYGKEASDINTRLVLGKFVTLFKDVSETDRYDRLLRYVFVDGTFVNNELVKQGYALAVTYPPDVSCAELFREAENYARTNGRGLWASQTLTKTASQTIIILAVNKVDEYVDIKNIGSAKINLEGWVLLSERGNQRCPLSGSIDPGDTLRIWAGKSKDGFSCRFKDPIWNNLVSDPAVLLNPEGEEVDRY